MAPEKKKWARISAWLAFVLFVADRLDWFLKVIQAPGNALTFWGYVRNMLFGFTPQALAVLLAALVCLAVALSDSWWPWVRAFLVKHQLVSRPTEGSAQTPSLQPTPEKPAAPRVERESAAPLASSTSQHPFENCAVAAELAALVSRSRELEFEICHGLPPRVSYERRSFRELKLDYLAWCEDATHLLREGLRNETRVRIFNNIERPKGIYAGFPATWLLAGNEPPTLLDRLRAQREVLEHLRDRYKEPEGKPMQAAALT